MSDSAQSATQTDEQLMLAFSHGDTAAFDELFSRYRQRIFAFLRRRTSDLTHAEELTQETFLALLRGSSRYQPRSLFRTYLYAIAFKSLARTAASPLSAPSSSVPPRQRNTLRAHLETVTKFSGCAKRSRVSMPRTAKFFFSANSNSSPI